MVADGAMVLRSVWRSIKVGYLRKIANERHLRGWRPGEVSRVTFAAAMHFVGKRWDGYGGSWLPG
jgi:hypothetical protein